MNGTSTVHSFFSSLWLTIITLTSVGYGDLYPSSFLGKIIGIILSLWGSFVLSLLVTIIQTIFELSGKESSAVKEIRLKRSAAKSILQALRFNVMKKKYLKMQRNDQIVLTAQQQSKLSIQLQEQSRRSSLS